MLNDRIREQVGATVEQHLNRMGWEDGDQAYALGMILTDLIVWARIVGVDFDDQLRTARETFDDVFAADFEDAEAGHA